MNYNKSIDKMEMDADDVCIQRKCKKQFYGCTLYNLLRMMQKDVDILVRKCENYESIS